MNILAIIISIPLVILFGIIIPYKFGKWIYGGGYSFDEWHDKLLYGVYGFFALYFIIPAIIGILIFFGYIIYKILLTIF